MQRDDIVDEVTKLSIHHSHQITNTGENASPSTAARLVAEASGFRRETARDITDEFVAATRELKPGELVKDDFFTLFESVGALEIMDPKMDSGFVPAGDGGIQFDVDAPLTPEQTLGIIDQLICHEMAWLSGLPLSQTLFTSLHLDALLQADEVPLNDFPIHRDGSNLCQAMTHVVLRSYCIATIAAIDAIREVIMSSIFYDEEDFVPHLYGREDAMLPSITTVDAEKLLDETHNVLNNKSNTMGDAIRQALITRIAWRRCPFAAVNEMPTSYSAASATMLKYIVTSHNLATQVPEAFSEKVQRHLATSTPPRPMFQLDWDPAMAVLLEMHRNIALIPSLTSFELRQSPTALHRAVWAFADREPAVYPRAIMQAILSHGGRMASADDDDVFNISEAILSDMRDLVMAGDERADPASFIIEVTSDWRHRTSRILEDFIMACAYEPFQDLYIKICQNRCRIRRYFTQAMQQWHDLQQLAATPDVDLINAGFALEVTLPPTTLVWQLLRNTSSMNLSGQTIQFRPLTSWAYFHKLQITEWHVQMGFETDVYMQDEYALMYAHLCSVSAMRHDLVQQMALALEVRCTTRYTGKRYAAERGASMVWLRSQLCHTKITACLAAALWAYCSALLAAHVIKQPPRTHSQAQLQAEARMKPYLPFMKLEIQGAEEAFIKYIHERDRWPTYVEDQVKFAQVELAALKAMSPEQAKYFGTEDQWNTELKALQQVGIAVKAQHFRLKMMLKDRASLDGSAVTENRVYNRWWVVPWIKELSS